MIEYSPKTDLQNGAYLIAIIRQWDRYGEGRRQVDSRIEVPDFDLAPVDIFSRLTLDAQRQLRVNPITTRNKAIIRLGELLHGFDPGSVDGQFMRWKIRSLSARAQAEQGRKYNFSDYIEETLALEKDSPVFPNYVPESEIEAQRKRVQEFYARVGHDYTREGFAKFLGEYGLAKLDHEAIKLEFRQWDEELTPVMQKSLGVDWRPSYEIIFVDEPEYWVNWVSGDLESGYKYRVNTNERSMKRLFRGSPARLISHEVVTHLFQHHSWALNGEAGLINLGYLLTTVPGPEQANNEAEANSITRWIPELYEKLDDFGKLSVEQTLYEDMVLRNFHIWINTEQVSRERAHEYLNELVPSIAEDNFDTVIRERTEDPRDRSYLLAYGYSYEHCKYAKLLEADTQPQPRWSFRRAPEPVDKRIDFIKFSFRQPLTMLQVHNCVAFLEKQKQEAKQKKSGYWYDPLIGAGREFIAKLHSGRVYSIHGTGESTERTS